MVKIVDVAKHAGVSTATVSRVLNGNGRVAENLRAKVAVSVNELGYNPNSTARSLRTLRSSKVLMLVPDISNPFFGGVIRGAEEAARQSGFSVVLGDTRDDPAFEDKYAAMLGQREVDGLIFLGHRLPAPLRNMPTSGAGRCAVVNGCEYSPELGVSSVHIDNRSAGMDAVAYLYSLGHRRIGLITGGLDSPLSLDRLRGARVAATQFGKVELCIRSGDFSIDSGYREAAGLIADRVTAIFCFSDEMALGAMAAIRAASLDCPQDISVLGFDDVRFAGFSSPALTTINQPATEIGRTAFGLLHRQLQHIVAVPEIVVLPHSLVIRESCRARGAEQGA